MRPMLLFCCIKTDETAVSQLIGWAITRTNGRRALGSRDLVSTNQRPLIGRVMVMRRTRGTGPRSAAYGHHCIMRTEGGSPDRIHSLLYCHNASISKNFLKSYCKNYER